MLHWVWAYCHKPYLRVSMSGVSRPPRTRGEADRAPLRGRYTAVVVRSAHVGHACEGVVIDVCALGGTEVIRPNLGALRARVGLKVHGRLATI